MRFLDPVSLARLRGLSLGLRRLAAEGHASGRHHSPWRGVSRDFVEHRAYVPGDPVRDIDWKLYARQDRYYVREYRAETTLTTHVLLDASGSMSYAGAREGSKWELACRLAMGTAYLVLAHGDQAGLSELSPRPRVSLPPRGSFAQLELIDETLAKLAPGGAGELARGLARAASEIRRRALTVVVSDLMGEPEAVVAMARSLKARCREVIVLQVLDPIERDFDFEGPCVFEGLEGPSSLFCDASALRPLYRADFERWLRFYEAGFARAGIPYGAFYAGLPWESALGRLVTRWQ